MGQPGIMFYFEKGHALLKMSDAQLGAFFRAALLYGENGTEPSFSGAESIIWELIRADLDRDADRYRSVSEKRRQAARSRWCPGLDEE